MIHSPKEYVVLSETVPKAAALARLYMQGYPVPAFYVLVYNPDSLQSDVVTICKQLAVPLYAVRFAAEGEDTTTESQAGFFVSALAVTSAGLKNEVERIVSEGTARLLPGKRFAIIIQEYIDADSSGVAFSRHPTLINFMRIEYGVGAGAVVSGEGAGAVDVPRHLSPGELPLEWRVLISYMKKIEHDLDFPQDIEWCKKGEKIYLTQSRPITTISQADWEATKCVDEKITETPYRFESGATVETYHNALPFDVSLLEYIHVNNGPVARAYRRFSLYYAATSAFTQFGNALLSNTLKEQQSLFPSYRFTPSGTYQIAWFPVQDLIRTSYNSTVSKRPIQARVLTKTLEELSMLLCEDMPTNISLSECIQLVDKQYEIIYATNYITASGTSNTLLDALEVVGRLRAITPPRDLVGNSMVVSDNSHFVSAALAKLSAVDALRELARWQSVRLRTLLDRALQRVAESSNCDYQLLLHATLEELYNPVKVSVLQERARVYMAQQAWHFPSVISSFQNELRINSQVLAPGKASGTLVTEETLRQFTGSKILFVHQLSPDVVQYYSAIQGVVCASGSMLSHAAIIAREQGLVVLQISADSSRLLGKNVSISDSGLSESQ